MGYRDYALPDGRVVKTRISDDATLAWYAQRKELTDKGYPDRPPDVDSDTQRVWIDSNKTRRSGVHPSALPVAFWVVNLGPSFPTLKLIVSALWPGDAYMLRFKMESGLIETPGLTLADFDRLIPYSQVNLMMDDFIFDALEMMGQAASMARLLGSEPEWILTGPLDIQQTEREMDEAIEEYHIEFGEPETEPEPVYPPPPGTGH